MSANKTNDADGWIDGFALMAARDRPDLRDQIYRPTLRPLGADREFHPNFVSDDKKTLKIAIRDQGDTSTCTGQSLAALVDILRQQQLSRGFVEPASANMLYHVAREYETGLQAGHGLLSMRSVIKAFYHYGVCADGCLRAPGDSKTIKLLPRHWSFRPDAVAAAASAAIDDPDAEKSKAPPNFLTVDRAKSARETPLGAYYRVLPRLNDFHAAINEVGAILVSAHIHDGWSKQTVAANGGEIKYQIVQPRGAHAFVIVGYNNAGFLVLNSWGEEWGRYKGFSGVALWRYGDWADSILDAWVLRLGVSTPGAFQFSIGEQGLGYGDVPAGAARGSAGSTPCLELLGHFAHLDDGYHVTRGPYATSPAAVNETIRYLGGTAGWPKSVGKEAHDPEMGTSVAKIVKRSRPQGYRGVLLWIGGSLEGMKDAVALAVNRKDRVKAKQLYPYSVLWCSDFVEETTGVLAGMFESAKKRVGKPGPELDLAIEAACRGVGRSFWRDIGSGARRATQTDGEGAHILDSFLGLDQLDLHLVVDGAGAIFLDRYLSALARDPKRRDEKQVHLDNILSVDLITPAIRLDQILQHQHWANFLKRFPRPDRRRRWRMRERQPVRLWVPGADAETRLRVDTYGKSILHLISNSFESRLPDWRREPLSRPRNQEFDALKNLTDGQRERGLAGPPLLGMAVESTGLPGCGHADKWETADLYDVREIPVSDDVSGPLFHQQLVQTQALFDLILAHIAGEAGPAWRSRT